ncbi:hypothetical protein GE09DRAFT_1064889 [Coniochaeta sp. 2T2.1]|nr:hypothetical protein GE09DRAFT_1064889 [Coniochaeta sp. 2T2.1]
MARGLDEGTIRRRENDLLPDYLYLFFPFHNTSSHSHPAPRLLNFYYHRLLISKLSTESFFQQTNVNLSRTFAGSACRSVSRHSHSLGPVTDLDQARRQITQARKQINSLERQLDRALNFIEDFGYVNDAPHAVQDSLRKRPRTTGEIDLGSTDYMAFGIEERMGECYDSLMNDNATPNSMNQAMFRLVPFIDTMSRQTIISASGKEVPDPKAVPHA